MTALTLALLASVLLAVPGQPLPVVRLRAILPSTDLPSRVRVLRSLRGARLSALGRRGTTWPAVAAGAVLGTIAGGPVVGVAGAVALGVVARLTRHAVTTRRRRQELDSVIEALATLTGELRAGRTPVEALRTAAAMAGGVRPDGAVVGSTEGRGAADTLLVAAATASVGGDVPAAIRATAAGQPADLTSLFCRISAAWQVSARSGASLATVLALVERDARTRAQHSRQLAAELAGPRATAVLLAVLPGLGLLLGTAMGAHPLATLLHTPGGRFSLLTGVVLDAAGAVWTLRLMDRGAGS